MVPDGFHWPAKAHEQTRSVVDGDGRGVVTVEEAYSRLLVVSPGYPRAPKVVTYSSCGVLPPLTKIVGVESNVEGERVCVSLRHMCTV